MQRSAGLKKQGPNFSTPDGQATVETEVAPCPSTCTVVLVQLGASLSGIPNKIHG